MSYTALNALAELDKFPGFRGDLADVLNASSHYSTYGMNQQEAGDLLAKLLRLGHQINMRSMLELSLDEERPNREILRRAFHNDPKV